MSAADTVVVEGDHRVAFLEFASAEAMAGRGPGTRRGVPARGHGRGSSAPSGRWPRPSPPSGRTGSEELLPLIQPQAPSLPAAPHGPRTKKAFAELRLSAAAALGVDPVEPRPLARIQLAKVLMLLGTFFGLWLLVSQLVGLGGIGEVLAGRCGGGSWRPCSSPRPPR